MTTVCKRLDSQMIIIIYYYFSVHCSSASKPLDVSDLKFQLKLIIKTSWQSQYNIFKTEFSDWVTHKYVVVEPRTSLYI